MNRPTSSKFVPGLPDDDNITAPTNVNPISDDDSIKIYDGVAESTVNDDDTVKNVKIRAKNLAQHKVQEKIADYVDAFLRDRLLKFPKEEIWSVASKIFTITDVKYNFIDSDDDKTIIRATVLAKVDDKDIMNYIIKTFKEIETLRKENDDLKRQNDNLSRENANLKRQNAYLNQKIDELTPKPITVNKIILSSQKSNSASSLVLRSYYQGAIELCNEAIQLNPNNAAAYNTRGNAYIALGYKEKAQADFKKVKELGFYN